MIIVDLEQQRPSRSMLPSEGVLKYKKQYLSYYKVDHYDKTIFTFDNVGSSGAVEQECGLRKGWGHHFLKLNKLNAICFMETSKKGWFRSSDFREFINILKGIEFLPKKGKRISYASSMGAYGASCYGKILEIDINILINPISTLNTEKAPWEKRFVKARNHNLWHEDLSDGALCLAEQSKTYIFYDPLYSLDRNHYKRYEKYGNGEVIPLRYPGVGHAIPKHLQSIGLLKETILNVINSEFETAGYFKKLKRRKHYPHFYNFILSRENIHLTNNRFKVINRYRINKTKQQGVSKLYYVLIHYIALLLPFIYSRKLNSIYTKVRFYIRNKVLGV